MSKTPKPHILLSREPLKEGENHEALCGYEVKKAAWVWTEGEVCTISDWLEKLWRVCPKCKAKFYESGADLDVVKVYGAVDGQISRDEVQEWL